MGKPFAVSDADFEDKVVKASRPVLVDFWAEWCMPCKMIAPMVEEVAEEYKDKMDVAKLDVESSPQTAAKYRIRSIPALLIFKDGKPIEQVVGAVPKAVLKKRLDVALSR